MLKFLKNNLLYIVFSVVLLTLAAFLYNEYKSHKITTSQVNALTDTVNIYKTRDGKNAAKISVLEGKRSDLEEILKRKDSELYNLAKKTKNLEYLISLKTVTSIDTIAHIDTFLIKLPGDTVFKPIKDNVNIFAYKTITNKYYQANLKLQNDSLDLKLKVYNDFAIMTRYESNGWFKPKTLIVDVINQNPYTETTGLSSYKFEQKKKHTGLKIIGIAAGIVGGYLLLK